ncbi:MAG: enoyl-CoA hydratase-related protein [Acidimicrobiales bacterium]
MDTGPVIISRPRPEVAVITLSRPDRLNAMDFAMIEGLHGAIDEFEADVHCRVIVLTGAGRGFCSGLDVLGYGDAGPPAGLSGARATMAVQKRIAGLILRLRALPQPVIAAVNGPAAGGGLALVLGSDIRLAARAARFNVAFIRIGLSACDIGTSWLLPRIVGVARAQELMLTGRLFDADEAYRIGLVTHLYDDEDLMGAALDKADEICRNAPWGVILTKEAMWAALEIPGLQAAIDLENRQQVLLSTGGEFAEARRAFSEKRPPNFAEVDGDGG